MSYTWEEGDYALNEVTFTVRHCNDCPESIPSGFGEHGRLYVCIANDGMRKIKDFTSIPNWCPLLNKKNYIRKAAGELE